MQGLMSGQLVMAHTTPINIQQPVCDAESCAQDYGIGVYLLCVRPILNMGGGHLYHSHRTKGKKQLNDDISGGQIAFTSLGDGSVGKMLAMQA